MMTMLTKRTGLAGAVLVLGLAAPVLAAAPTPG